MVHKRVEGTVQRREVGMLQPSKGRNIKKEWKNIKRLGEIVTRPYCYSVTHRQKFHVWRSILPTQEAPNLLPYFK